MDSLLQHAISKLDAKWVQREAAIVRGDCLDMLPLLPTASFDLAICDPPYFLSNGGTTVSGGKRVAVSKGGWDESAGVRADFDFHRRWLRALQRVLKPTATAWVSGTHHCLYSIGFAMQLSGWNVLNHVTWEKPNPPPNVGCRCLTHSTEGLIWASPNRDRPLRHVFNYDDAKAETGKQMKDVWRGTSPAAEEKELGRHPAMKPRWLMERIVELSSAKGAVVLDCFAGSGSSGVAALSLGRRYVGLEVDPAYAELALLRVGSVKLGQLLDS